MRNRKLIYFFALSLSIIFSLFYLLVFHYYIPSDKEDKQTTLYLNQIGLYKEESNAQKVQSDLQSKQISSYLYKKDDIYVVVCGVSEIEKETQKVEEQLKNQAYSYLSKKIAIKDDEISTLIEAKQYQKALEMIGNQS
ncbi:MAG: SPOR domain-containing protein [Erysipelotrichia bacterium]|nr:SPOR domain-containing protein [Erysipelotrichia bacterium]NCC54658.1 SPOR domain-containing protein [Erysipelotrichia bacterium]